MKSIHQQVKQKAANGLLKLADLKPNSREVAKRLINSGELITSRCGKGYVLNKVAA